MALHRWENSFHLAAFTVVTVLFSSYMSTTNCSIFSNAVRARFAFSTPSSKKADVTVGNAVHVIQAFSYPVLPKSETVPQPRERQVKLLICLHQDNCVGCNVSEMFSSTKCNPQLFHLYFFNSRDCKYNNVSVGSSYYYLLRHEELLVCRPLRGCSH